MTRTVVIIQPPSLIQNGDKLDTYQKRAPTLKWSLHHGLTRFEVKFSLHQCENGT